MSHQHPEDTAGKVRVDIDLMYQDAKLWADSSSEISTASTIADGMPLDQPTWSFAGDEACAAYQELQQWLAGLLKDASKKLEDMSIGLGVTAMRYQRQDEESAKDFERLHEYLG